MGDRRSEPPLVLTRRGLWLVSITFVASPFIVGWLANALGIPQ